MLGCFLLDLRGRIPNDDDLGFPGLTSTFIRIGFAFYSQFIEDVYSVLGHTDLGLFSKDPL